MTVVRVSTTNTINTAHFAAFGIVKGWGGKETVGLGGILANALPAEDCVNYPYVLLVDGLDRDDAVTLIKQLATAQAMEPMDALAAARSFAEAWEELDALSAKYKSDGDQADQQS